MYVVLYDWYGQVYESPWFAHMELVWLFMEDLSKSGVIDFVPVRL